MDHIDRQKTKAQNPKNNNMPTEKQLKGAKLVNQYRLVENATGKSVSLASILEQAGFSPISASQANRIVSKSGFQQALKVERERTQQLEDTFEARLINIQDTILKRLEDRGMDSAGYRELKDLLGTVGSMIRLSQNKSTENVAVVSEIKTPEDAKKYLQESGISI